MSYPLWVTCVSRWGIFGVKIKCKKAFKNACVKIDSPYNAHPLTRQAAMKSAEQTVSKSSKT